MSTPLIGIIVGSSRQGRFGEVPAHWIYRMAEQRDDLRIELIDLGNHHLPFYRSPVLPTPQGAEGAAAHRWAAVLDRLDGFIVVASDEDSKRNPNPIAEAGRLHAEFVRKPVAFVGYGRPASDAGADPLRSVALELQMVPVKPGVHVSKREALGLWCQGKTFNDFPHLGLAATAMLDELAWWAGALKTAREDRAERESAVPQPIRPARSVAPAKTGFVHGLAHRVRLAASRAGASAMGSMALVALLTLSVPGVAAPRAGTIKPTVVLVHGAFADSSSWDGVTKRLLSRGFPVIAAANPLRGVQSDARYVAGIVDSIAGPVILVGHSYGGSVITNAMLGKDKVKALVFVAGFAPDTGETAAGLAGKYPGSTLGPTLAPPVALADGGKDLYIQPSKFRAQFAADLPASKAELMAAGQRPIAEAALNEPSGTPSWKQVPSWFIYGSKDLNIPPVLQPFMAQRAGARRTVVVNGASHVVMSSHPDSVVQLIVEVARAADE